MPVSPLRLEYIYRYPVKSLSGQILSSAKVEFAGILPGDREYAFAPASSDMDLENPSWASKKHFLNLARDEKLAELSAQYSEDTHTLSLLRQDKVIVTADITTPQGRMVIEGFLTSFMPANTRAHARLVRTGSGHFGDNKENYLSLVNLASIADIARVVRKPLEHERFRSNLYFSGARPWQEQKWIGKHLKIGNVVAEVADEIPRCNAINLEPKTGKHDTNIPLAMQRGFRHKNCGVFLRILEGGTLKSSDTIEVLGDE